MFMTAVRWLIGSAAQSSSKSNYQFINLYDTSGNQWQQMC